MDVTIIPPQQRGLRTGASTSEEAPTRHDAILLFEEAKRRLLDINNWHSLCGPGSATFQLTDDGGRELRDVKPETGHLIRISLPAPPNAEGDGYDWVRIEEIENKKDMLKDQNIFGFRVRPVNNPLSTRGKTAHFYTSGATSTFLIIRVSSVVKAMEKGRNEVVNAGMPAVVDGVRNFFVALGAWLGFSKSQWGKLVKGIIKGPPHT
jgi:hypothetical protein